MKCLLCTEPVHAGSKHRGIWWTDFQLCRNCYTKIANTYNGKSLESYKRQICDLAKIKLWNDANEWLIIGLYLEVDEVVRAIMNGSSDEKIAEEWADVMHFGLQLLNKTCKKNLDKALNEKIESNHTTPKKTLVDGKFVLR